MGPDCRTLLYYRMAQDCKNQDDAQNQMDRPSAEC